MDIVNKIYKYFIFYPILLLRGQNVYKHLKVLNKTQFLNKKELREIQIKKLILLINSARENTEFYNQKEYNLNPDNFSLEEFSKFPFIEKKDIRDFPESFKSKNHNMFLHKKTTGGSTGEPVALNKTPFAMSSEIAATYRGYSWAGVDIGDKQARFWGISLNKKDRLKYKIIDFIGHRKRISAFSFDDEKMENYIKIVQEFKPNYFYGYVSMLEKVAEFVSTNKINLGINLKSIITTAEVLTDTQKKKLENAFSVMAFNEYGSGEFGPIANQCDEGNLHINAENLLVEIIDGDRICGPGEVGELVITELNNFAFPLIRYRMGDYASLSNKTCSCGRELPIIENLFGRSYDMIKNKNGKLFHAEFFMYIIEEAKRNSINIKAFQIIQTKIDEFLIKLVSNKEDFERAKIFIKKRILKDFSSTTHIEFVSVETIERSASGKMRLVIGLSN